MPINKCRSYVGFAVKKGSALFGVDNVIASKKKPSLILWDEHLSQNSQSRLTRYAIDRAIPIQKFPLHEVLPNRNCLALGITDVHLSDAIQNAIKEI